MEIRNRINELRGNDPLWQVAQRARIPESSLARVANARGPGPQIATAFKIATALGAEINEVFFVAEESESAKR